MLLLNEFRIEGMQAWVLDHSWGRLHRGWLWWRLENEWLLWLEVVIARLLDALRLGYNGRHKDGLTIGASVVIDHHRFLLHRYIVLLNKEGIRHF